MDETLAREAFADAGLGQQVDRALLEQTGADAGAQILGRATLQYGRFAPDGTNSFDAACSAPIAEPQVWNNAQSMSLEKNSK